MERSVEASKKAHAQIEGLDAFQYDTAANRQVSELRIKELKIEDFSALARLAAHSDLPTWSKTQKLRQSLERDIVFGGFLGSDLVCCCCIKENIHKEFLTRDGRKAFPLPNIYFCGAFVLAVHRGLGIGDKLYSHRLDFAKHHYKGTIIVELFGNGTPFSVKPGTRAGYNFYLRNNFKELGYSVDEDAGLIVFLEID
jgi:GNAT superfamily N-acetyltransferase